jgi:hypothetical protein
VNELSLSEQVVDGPPLTQGSGVLLSVSEDYVGGATSESAATSAPPR